MSCPWNHELVRSLWISGGGNALQRLCRCLGILGHSDSLHCYQHHDCWFFAQEFWTIQHQKWLAYLGLAKTSIHCGLHCRFWAPVLRDCSCNLLGCHGSILDSLMLWNSYFGEYLLCVNVHPRWGSAGKTSWLRLRERTGRDWSSSSRLGTMGSPTHAKKFEFQGRTFFQSKCYARDTMVVNFLWSCAFLWALYGAWFGMDFKNSKAAVQSWRDPLPLLDVSGETMASPSPFWKPHALVCPRKQVFVADRYHVYELKNNNTKVERYPCLINGTIADVAAACDEKLSCWPVVLLQGVPPLVLDCSTGRQDPLLQTTADAGRIATDADNEHKLQTLVATMGDKMIVQYGWSVQREAWEPLWDIENTVGVLAMDLISDRLLVFHEGGYVQAQDMQTGRLCSTWAFDSKDAVIGGGCGNKKYKTILILVKKGHGTTLMRAELPGLDECTGKANRPAVSLIAWRSEMVPSRFVATLCQVSVKVCGLWLSKGFMKVGPCVRAIQESKGFQRMWMVWFGVRDVLNGQSATCNMFETSGNMQTEKSWNWWTWHFASFFGAVSFIFGYCFPQLSRGGGHLQDGLLWGIQSFHVFYRGRDNETLLSLTVFEGISKNNKTT